MNDLYGVGCERNNIPPNVAARGPTIKQLIHEIDNSENVFVIVGTSATTPPDYSLIYKSRFEKLIHIDFPDYNDRKAILDECLKSVECSGEDFSQIYMYTRTWKIASIMKLANKAILAASAENSTIITKKHLIDSRIKLVPTSFERMKTTTNSIMSFQSKNF